MQNRQLMNQKISAIILTKNNEEIIVDCLESVKWIGEIIIIDDNSTDRTVQFAQKNKLVKIVKAGSKDTFSKKRNLGAQNAKKEWLLYVDSDERVTPVLRNEIEKIVEDGGSEFAAYAIPRRNIRLTKELHFGGWWPDYVVRLIKKDKLKAWKGDLHEQPEVEGRVGYLKEALVHFSHRGSLENKLQNTINWSKIEAQKLYESGHPPMTIPRFLSAMWREFYFRMIKKQAFRDGTEGVIEAFYQVFSVFISYARLWELQAKKGKI